MSDEELLEHAADDFTNAVDEPESIAGIAYSNRSIAASLLVIARHSQIRDAAKPINITRPWEDGDRINHK